jgi:hypothetical protein
MYIVQMVESSKFSKEKFLTNLRFTIKGRHPRRGNGGDSAREKGKEEKKSLYIYDISDLNMDGKKDGDNYNKKWNQLIFK